MINHYSKLLVADSANALRKGRGIITFPHLRPLTAALVDTINDRPITIAIYNYIDSGTLSNSPSTLSHSHTYYYVLLHSVRVQIVKCTISISFLRNSISIWWQGMSPFHSVKQSRLYGASRRVLLFIIPWFFRYGINLSLIRVWWNSILCRSSAFYN